MLEPEAYEPARRFFAAPHEVVRVPGGHFLHREHPQHFLTELLRVIPRAC